MSFLIDVHHLEGRFAFGGPQDSSLTGRLRQQIYVEVHEKVKRGLKQ